MVSLASSLAILVLSKHVLCYSLVSMRGMIWIRFETYSRAL